MVVNFLLPLDNSSWVVLAAGAGETHDARLKALDASSKKTGYVLGGQGKEESMMDA